ncbi:hypothetical protein WR25_17004 [Diploscapter pachys]|uniref:Major facilitator superfamily (MFS) profile domain-containing protein n=1 Tax=Diploscapter pachys TaxID=2018661 RepID=A0A2A2JKI8_9BILA|nr:hypothetical protein WR25_17004 [Diploscapter pachys]
MPSLSIHILSIALCLSAGFQQGYIASVLNQPYLQIEQYINESWTIRTGEPIEPGTLNIIWSLLNVCFPIATIFGQFTAGYTCKRLGRKKTAILATALYIPGTLLCAAAKWTMPYFELLFIGRIIWSWANGINSVNATVWIVECAAPQIRGRMASMQEVFMSIGSLVTQAFGVPFSTDELWYLNFVPNCFFSLVTLVMFFVVYESPQFIMEKEGNVEKARRALASYHGCAVDDASVDAEMRICEESVSKKKKSLAQKNDASVQTEFSGKEIMFMPWKANDPTSRVVRHAAWLGVMVKIAYVFTGARCVRAYSTFILHTMSHWSFNHSLYGSFAVGLLRLPVTLVPVFLVDRLGRRPLIIGSTAVSFLSLLTMMIGIEMGADWKIATFIGLSVLLLINACGIGSVSRFYSAELVPRHLLLSSVATLTMFEAITKIIVEFAFYPVANLIGAQSLLLFLIPTAIFMVLMWALCPETSRRTVNEVLNEIAQRKKLKVAFPM